MSGEVTTIFLTDKTRFLYLFHRRQVLIHNLNEEEMMRRKREKKTFVALVVPVMLGCALMVVSFPLWGQSAQPAAGLERHQKAGLTCQGCHKEAPPKVMVPDAQCMTCHGDLAKLIEKSNKAVPNPHASPHLNPGDQPKCDECHHIHKPSEVSCTNCHEEFKFRIP
jgi:hypothetical protein